jgi:hypothetical protein
MKLFICFTMLTAALAAKLVAFGAPTPRRGLKEGEAGCQPVQANSTDLNDSPEMTCDVGLTCDKGVCRSVDVGCWPPGTACACYPDYTCAQCCGAPANCKWAPRAYCGY